VCVRVCVCVCVRVCVCVCASGAWRVPVDEQMESLLPSGQGCSLAGCADAPFACGRSGAGGWWRASEWVGSL